MRSPTVVRAAARRFLASAAMGWSAATTSCIERFDAAKNPTLARVIREGSLRNYREGKDFRVVQLESGAQRDDLPVFTSSPGAVELEPETARRPPARTEAEGVPGGFVLKDILTPRECDQLVKLAETMGYTEDAPVSLARHIRQNENCVWIADPELNNALFERIRHLFPQEVEGGEVVGLNARWRLYKYNPEDVFRPHTDGSWPGSGLDAGGRLVRDLYRDRWSQLTIVFYLNDEFEGGPTRFFYPIDGRGREHRVAEVKAERGGAVCFFHGEHPQSPLHEGGLVTKGTKYIIRSDVLYKLPGRGPSFQDGWRQHYEKLDENIGGIPRDVLMQMVMSAPPEKRAEMEAAILAKLKQERAKKTKAEGGQGGGGGGAESGDGDL